MLALRLDGEIRNAFSRIEHSLIYERTGRASIETARAAAAMGCLERLVGSQGKIEQERAEKEVAAEFLVDEHRILAEPAEPGAAREIAFQKRRGIDDGSAARAGRLVLDPGEQRFFRAPFGEIQRDLQLLFCRICLKASHGSVCSRVICYSIHSIHLVCLKHRLVVLRTRDAQVTFGEQLAKECSRSCRESAIILTHRSARVLPQKNLYS